MIETEGAKIDFTDEGVEEIAHIAMGLNDRMENIGARRLQTVMTTLLEEVLFELPEGLGAPILVDRDFVRSRLKKVADDEDLSRYIL
jgi:ATP-dependent HslUV protease ATP-binding subunit HslU